MTRYSATLPRSGLTRCAHILCGLSRRLTPSVSNRYGVAPCIVPRDAEDAEVKRKAESELSCAFACALTYACGPKQEAMMPLHTDNLESTMRYALLTTRAIALCPFHPEGHDPRRRQRRRNTCLLPRQKHHQE